MTCRPSLSARSASASPARRFRSSDSTTHGPAIRKGEPPPPKCCGMSVAAAGELRRPLRLGEAPGAPGAVPAAVSAHEPGELVEQPRWSTLERAEELPADVRRGVVQLDAIGASA